VAGSFRIFRIEKPNAEARGDRIELDFAALIGKAPVTAKGRVGAGAPGRRRTPYPFDLTISSARLAPLRPVQVGALSFAEISAEIPCGRVTSLIVPFTTAEVSAPLGPCGFAGRACYSGGTIQANSLGGSSLGGNVALQLAKRPKATATLAADQVNFKDFGAKSAATRFDSPDVDADRPTGRAGCRSATAVWV